MIERVSDLETIADIYLRQLNTCFPGWGGRAMFDWCFRRTAGGPAADLFVARDEAGELLAGSAVTYRRLAGGGRAGRTIACMTGSWTSPAARGRGLFKEMIEASRIGALRRGCSAMAAFVSMDNPSAAALVKAGAALVPAAYLAAPPKATAAAMDILTSGEAMAVFRARPTADGHLTLSYTPSEWEEQFLARPNPVVAMRAGNGVCILVERRVSGDHVLELSCPDAEAAIPALEQLSGWAALEERPLKAWFLKGPLATGLMERGFAGRRGALCLLKVGEETPPLSGWWLCNGDRM